jgi:hypothetical protein
MRLKLQSTKDIKAESTKHQVQSTKYKAPDTSAWHKVPMTEQESPFACDMSAIAGDQRGKHLLNLGTIFQAVEKFTELPDGYSFRLQNKADILIPAAHFIELERKCCPFFGFRLEVEREGGAVWLSLTGREGVKPFIMSEISEHLRSNIKHIEVHHPGK